MNKSKVTIVSLITLLAFLAVPTQSLALSLKCPINEYGIEECDKATYGEEGYKVESYAQEQNPIENVPVDTAMPAHNYYPLILVVLAIGGLILFTLRKRIKNLIKS